MNFGNTSLGSGTGQLLNINTPSTLFGFLWDLVFSIGLAICVIFVIMAGIKFITSSGDEGKFNEAKEALIYAIVGALTIIGFTVILNFVLGIFGSAGIGSYLSENGGTPSTIILKEGDYDAAVSGGVITSIGNSLTVVLFLLRNLSLALALLFIIIAGIKFATSSGDPDKVAEAKGTITWAIVGALAAISFYSILYMLASAFGVKGLDASGSIKLLPPDFYKTP